MNSLFIDYENSLIGRSKEINSYHFFGSEAGGTNQQRAITCIRYAFEDLLEMKPEEVVRRLDIYLIHVMKLDKVLNYINWPSEVEPGNIKYLLSLMYPNLIKLNQQKMVENIYKGVLQGTNQFPRDFFAGSTGMYRYCACLKYLIENYKSFYNIEDMYDFLLSSSGRSFLNKYRLLVPAKQLEINLIDCIHLLTSDCDLSELYYHYYSFISQLNTLQQNE